MNKETWPSQKAFDDISRNMAKNNIFKDVERQDRIISIIDKLINQICKYLFTLIVLYFLYSFLDSIFKL